MLIKNATLITCEDKNIENGYILTEGAKIKALGEMKNCPTYHQGDVVDARGGYVTPGIIDAHSHVGLFGTSLRWEGEDGNEMTDTITPEMRAIDSIDPFDQAFDLARKGGVTTLYTGPGSGNNIGGIFCSMKTWGIRVDDMVIQEAAFMKMALGENPKGPHHRAGKAPKTRMANAAKLREALMKATQYMQKKAQAQFDKQPEYNASWEALIPVLQGTLPVQIHCHRADDILTAIRIMNEFHLHYILVHATDGHLIADELVKEKARCILGPSLGLSGKPETKNLTFDTSGILYAKGLEIALTTDAPVIPVEYLPLCAGLAVQHGLPEDAAFKAITLNAAKMGGLEERLGSLKIGKDADIVVWNGHPFDTRSKVTAVLIDGVRRV